MRLGCIVVMILLLGLVGITLFSPKKLASPPTPPPSAGYDAVVATAGEARECEEAKSAVVVADEKYAADYERRNPGVPSTRTILADLDTCLIAKEGVFVGKWKGKRLWFTPGRAKLFSNDPKRIWISDAPASNEPRLWFSDWRAEDAPSSKGKELDVQLSSAKAVQ